MRVMVAPQLASFVDPALVRLRYLFPEIEFAVADGGVEVCSSVNFDGPRLVREVNYAIYREKIFSETLGLRSALLDMVRRA